MSFGFKKKLLSSNKGKKSTITTNKTKEKDADSSAQNETLASNSNSSILKLDNACCVGDKNGNIGKYITHTKNVYYFWKALIDCTMFLLSFLNRIIRRWTYNTQTTST